MTRKHGRGWKRRRYKPNYHEMATGRVLERAPRKQLTRGYSVDQATGELVERPIVRWHQPNARREHYEFLNTATPASRTDQDLNEERTYRWRGMANPAAFRLALQIKDQIPPEDFFKIPRSGHVSG